MSNTDGGPAFPIPASFSPDGTHEHYAEYGISHREYLEAQCLMGFCAGMPRDEIEKLNDRKMDGWDYINAARALASTMLAARGGDDAQSF